VKSFKRFAVIAHSKCRDTCYALCSETTKVFIFSPSKKNKQKNQKNINQNKNIHCARKPRENIPHEIKIIAYISCVMYIHIS